MRANIISDLHLEFGPMTREPEGGELLILAGDTYTKARVGFINKMAERYENVIVIDGNHEFYHGDLKATMYNIRANVAKNVYHLQNESVEIGGVTFHGCVLWTSMKNGDPLLMNRAVGMLNDFRLISDKHYSVNFSPTIWIEEFQRSYKFLRNRVKPGDVVITHHGPTRKAMSPKYSDQGDMNYLFFSDLDDFIIDHKPQLWVHGHTHESADIYVGDTRIICNPRGYRDENPNFNLDLTLELTPHGEAEK